MNFTAYASSSKGNLYALEDGQSSILIECGLPYKEMARLLPKPPTSYDSCVISHLHGDHCNKRSAASLLERGVSVLFGESLRDGVTFGTIKVKSFEVKHDVPNYGFIFRSSADGETCVFLIDTFYCPIIGSEFGTPEIVAIECNFMSDIIRGCNRADRLLGTHMSLEQCIKTLETMDLSQTREIHLLHMSRSYCKSCGDYHCDEDQCVYDVQDATGVPVFVAPKKIK